MRATTVAALLGSTGLFAPCISPLSPISLPCISHASPLYLPSISLPGNTGLFAPVARGSVVPRYDSYFVRTAAFDVPAEGMSAFAQEMDDLQVSDSYVSLEVSKANH